MVVRTAIPWLPVLRLHRPWLLAVVALGLLAVALEKTLKINVPLLAAPFSIVGVALSIFLAFRNNAGYDRWWEGRKLWGGIVNGSRTLARQCVTFARPAGAGEEEEVAAFRREMVHRTIAWVHALRGALRGDDVSQELEKLLQEDERANLATQRNKPAALAHALGARAADAAARGWLTEYRLARIDASVTELVALQGGCERILKTPIPLAYSFFTHRFVRVYCCALPFGLVEHLGAFTVVICVAVAFVFMVLETIGRIVETPFATGANGLPLHALSTTIEINLRQQLGETELPDDVQPVDGILR